jgi:hypothetical protein
MHDKKFCSIASIKGILRGIKHALIYKNYFSPWTDSDRDFVDTII